MRKSVKYLLISVLSVLFAASFALAGCGGKSEIIDDRTVSISQTELYLTIGEEAELTARLSVGKGKFVWSSSGENVATVTEDGTVKGVSLGTAVITAAYGDKKGVCTVNVVLPDGYPTFANPSQKLEIFENGTAKIDGRVLLGGEEVKAKLSFFSANVGVATVTENGTVKGVKEGKTEITVTADYEGLVNSVTVPVTVRGAVLVETEEENVRLQLVSDAAAGFFTNKTLSVRAFNDFKDVTDKITDVKWNMKNGSVASVAAVSDENGAKRAGVSAVGEGTTEAVCSFSYQGKAFEKIFAITVEKARYEKNTAVAYDTNENGGKTLNVLADIPTACETTAKLSAKVGEETLSFVKNTDGGIVVTRPAAEEKGEKKIVIADEKWECVYSSSYYCTGVLTQQSHRVLEAGGTIAAGEIYVMTEDINVGYTSDEDPLMIYGTLEGMGHTISGITISVEPQSGWTGDPIVNAHNYSAYIAENNGTIRNVRFDFVSEKLGEEQASAIFITLVQINRGVIENVVASGDFRTDAYRMSALVGKLYGTVRNTVTLVPQSETNYRHRIAGIAIFMYGGTVQNSYTCGSGFEGADETDAEGQNRCYLEKYNGGANVISWKGFSDASEIADVENFSENNGWSEYWVKTGYGFTFGGKDLSFEHREYFDTDYAEEENGEIVIKVPAGISFAGATNVYFGDTEAEFVSFAGGELRVKKGDIAYGVYNVVVETSAGKYEAKNVRLVTKALTQADAKNFKAILKAQPNGYFLLTEDLDFGMEMTEGTIELYGTLDGNGYSLKNLLIQYDNRGSDWESYLFSENAGTIKDLGVYCSLFMNGPKGSLVYKNKGVISNVYMEVTFINSADQWSSAPLVNANDGRVENCVVIISAADGVKIGNEVAAIVGRNNGNGSVISCYAATNGLTATDSFANVNEGTENDVLVANTAAEIAAFAKFDKESGWSEFWTAIGSEIIFGRYE